MGTNAKGRRARLGRGLAAMIEPAAPVEVETTKPSQDAEQPTAAPSLDQAPDQTPDQTPDRANNAQSSETQPSAASELAHDGSRVAEIELDQIVANKNQPRKVFDAEEIASLAASIQAHGVMQPVLVRANGDGGGY